MPAGVLVFRHDIELKLHSDMLAHAATNFSHTVGGPSYRQWMTTSPQLVRKRETACQAVAYPRQIMKQPVAHLADQEKEWFSRSFLVGIAAAAKFPVELTLNDVRGVDATVHDGGITTDWQLKGTSSPEYSADGQVLFFDLDVRTYDLFTGDRNSTAYLGVVVMPKLETEWAAVSDTELRLRNCG